MILSLHTFFCPFVLIAKDVNILLCIPIPCQELSNPMCREHPGLETLQCSKSTYVFSISLIGSLITQWWWVLFKPLVSLSASENAFYFLLTAGLNAWWWQRCGWRDKALVSQGLLLCRGSSSLCASLCMCIFSLQINAFLFQHGKR